LLFILTVLTAVEFDNQPVLGAEEVNDVRTERVLSTKPEATQLPATETSPQGALVSGLRIAQLTRALVRSPV
jgi:hypothetical protein